MVTKFFIFCETTSDSGSSVRYVNDILVSSEGLQERLVHLDSIGVNVFKVVPVKLDEKLGLVVL